MAPSLWDDDLIQFARLLCEIAAATTTTDVVWEEVAASMDLTFEAIDQLFDRAHIVWERAKESI